ncbi:unnamed protein product [Trichobilharzia szidati]|nr:unnamed protein product [Trichobilharzia szidati]
MHKSRQIDDGITKEPEVSGVAEPSTMKPPMVKKRKKKAKKLPNLDSNDGDMEKIKSVPLVEIKQPSLNAQMSEKEKQEGAVNVVVKKANPPVSASTSPPLKYEQSKQFAKSRFSYALPERMQRFRRSTAFGDVSTSPELSLSDIRGKENLGQISEYEFFVKEWFDQSAGRQSSLGGFISQFESQSTVGGGGTDEVQLRMLKTKRHKSLWKRTDSTTEDTSAEMNQENQPLLGLGERTKQDLLVFGRSPHLSSQERIQLESKFLYDPPDSEVPVELKTGGQLPRYLEDEGFFISKLPYVAPTNLRRLENRIINEIHMDVCGLKSILTFQSADNETLNGKVYNNNNIQEMEEKKKLKIQSWFREDGMLNLQSNPLKNIPSRPSLWNDQFNPLPEKFQIFYVQPLSPEMTQNYFNMQSEGSNCQHLSTSALNLSRNKQAGVRPIDKECRLDVDIRRITFDFHPLFSLEHVYAQNLRQIVKAYELALSRDQVNACIQRISALKRALKQLEGKRIANESTFNEDQLAEIDGRIEDYYHEISLMRRARNHAEAYEKGLLASALRAWKRVKEARVKSGCTNTTVRLKIAKQMTNVEQDLLDWNQELDEIVSEAKHQFDIEYQEAQRKYEEEMEVYKQEKKKLDAALRRQRLRESGQTDDLEDNPDLEREDAQILAKQKLLDPPPTSPKPFDAQVVRDEAEINLKKCRRLYNEPKVTVTLLEDAVISSNAECPKNELNRRLKMLEYAYFIKLYYNGKLVETTQPQLLTNYFTLDFRWILPIQIRHQPESIVAKLFEKHGWKSYQIGEFYIAPPSYEEMKMSSAIQTTTTTTAAATTPSSSSATSEFNLQCLRFTITTGASFKLVQSIATSPDISTSVAYVGLGGKLLLEALDGTGEKTVSLPITGTLYAMAKWVPSKSILNDLSNIEANSGYVNRRSAYINNSLKKSTTDLRSLMYPSMQMYQSNPLFLNTIATTNNNDNSTITNKLNFTTPTLDPNNTMDSKLLNIIQTMSGTHLLPSSLLNTNQPEVLCHTRAGGANYFHLDYALERYNFCTDEDLDKSKRLRLFRLRQKRVPGFQNIIIPSFARHISEDIFDSLTEKKSLDTHYSTLKGMKAYKQKHKMYIDKIKNEVNQHFQEALNKKSLREIVIEEEIPNILFLLPLFKRLFEPKRPLRPKYQERRRIGPQYIHDCGLELIVTIHSAYNLPIRSRKRTDQSDYRDNKMEDRNNPLKPFVEVKFQQHKKSTIPSEGRNPSWNTEFRFGFFLTAETPNLECMKDPIIINVYDQVTFSQAESEQSEPLSTSSSSHYIQRIEHRLIGSTEVPLSTVYLNSKVSGRINLSVPIILQGYETVNLAKSSIRPMVDVLMTLEPSIYPPAPLMDSFMTTESISIQSTLTKWYEKLSKHKHMSDRLFKPLVMNSDCQEVLMTRFLHPLNPPEDFLPGEKTGLTISESMLRLARYVSLIPYEPDAASFPGLAQVWCTCDQFLSMLRGDEEEHAVLLACYFMYILKFNTMDNNGDDADTSNVPPTSYQSSKTPVTSVYLCIGEAVPEGRTVYIMTEDLISQKHITESNNWRLWNPVTGQHYSVHDVNSPLRSVWGLVNSQNILANIQQKKEPWELVWDLTSTKCWLPVFSKAEVLDNSSASVQTIQPQTLLYASLESREVEHIKFELETVLRDALMDWRKTKITRLNYEFIKEFNKMLENLEKNNGVYYEGLGQLLDRISSKYHIYGFPMNFSYMEPHEIVARVKSKGIHEFIGSEFTLADVVSRFHHEEDQQQQHQPRSSMAFSKTTLTSLTDSLFTVGSGSHKASLTTPMRRLQSDSMNDVQFALNVYVKAYPGPVLSIWIYLAGLWRRVSME